MDVYKSLEDSLYAAIAPLLPDVLFVFPYGNFPEPQTPFVIIDVMRIDAVGREQVSSLTEDGVTTMVQTYEAKVRFEVSGAYDANTVVGEIAHELEFLLRTPLAYQAYHLNNLSLMRYGQVDRKKRQRDTQTYMCYYQDVYFSYAVSYTQDVGYIEVAHIDGVYYDAGRDGNIIETHIEIPNP